MDLLNRLNAEDAERLLTAGREQQVIAHTVLLEEGVRPPAVYVVLEGMLGVRVAAAGPGTLKSLGPGEVVGEMSLIDDGVASATVFAAENSLLLELPRAALDALLAGDAAFSARLYRALAATISGRMREGHGRLVDRGRELAAGRGQVTERWEAVRAAVDELQGLLAKADESARRQGGVVPEPLQQDIRSRFGGFCAFINAQLGACSGLPPAVQDELGARLQRELLPYVLLTGLAERLYAKPRGYAGDFLSIDLIYKDEATGTGRLGPLLDRCFLDQPAAAAVRNRRGLLAEEIHAAARQVQGRPARVTSLACGPAQELFDVYATLADPAQLQSTLIDIDAQALELVTERSAARGLQEAMRTVQGNLVYLALGRHKLSLEPQDLVYSIGLIDYFSDKFVVALLDYLHGVLRPGGKVILGNFHPSNPSRALMDHVLDWRLVHRSEQDMDALFLASRFGRRASRHRLEPAGVNLFAECVKDGG